MNESSLCLPLVWIKVTSYLTGKSVCFCHSSGGEMFVLLPWRLQINCTSRHLLVHSQWTTSVTVVVIGGGRSLAWLSCALIGRRGNELPLRISRLAPRRRRVSGGASAHLAHKEAPQPCVWSDALVWAASRAVRCWNSACSCFHLVCACRQLVSIIIISLVTTPDRTAVNSCLYSHLRYSGEYGIHIFLFSSHCLSFSCVLS